MDNFTFKIKGNLLVKSHINDRKLNFERKKYFPKKTVQACLIDVLMVYFGMTKGLNLTILSQNQLLSNSIKFLDKLTLIK